MKYYNSTQVLHYNFKTIYVIYSCLLYLQYNWDVIIEVRTLKRIWFILTKKIVVFVLD